MSMAQVLAELEKLPLEEQREVFEFLCEKFDDELTPEQIDELERRAAEAHAHPERGIPLDEVIAEMEKRFHISKPSDGSAPCG